MDKVQLIIELRGRQVWRRLGDEAGAPLPTTLATGHQPPPADAQQLLADWRRRYAQSVVASLGDEPLLPLGREMLRWLDTGHALRPWLLAGTRSIEVRVDGAEGNALTDALLAAPWEVLADDEGFLAARHDRPYLCWRQIGPPGVPRQPKYRDLTMLFMAAAPESQTELDYEAEESAILEATRDLAAGAQRVQLVVDESGELAVLKDRIGGDGPFDILHLSCHGDIRPIVGADGKPVGGKPVNQLVLENAKGGEHWITAEQLAESLGDQHQRPALLFLSACRSSEHGDGRHINGGVDHHRAVAADGPSSTLTAPLARRMALHVAHVVGWDGSVYDADATKFAQAFYAALGRGQRVAYAAAQARRSVLDARGNIPGRHWHLARLYIGANGGAPLSDAHQQGRPIPAAAAAEAFLDTSSTPPRIKVARRNEFVARRRELQQLRRIMASGSVGALIHGMGHLGKSSLAARLADRLAPRYRHAVVYGEYHEQAIFQALARSLRQLAAQRPFLEAQAMRDELAAMEQALGRDGTQLFDVVLNLLSRYFQQHPVLFIVDDLEQALEDPSAGDQAIAPRPAYQPALAALLQAFAEHRGPSKLLLTSRYDFALFDATGRDLSRALERLPLKSMAERSRIKQWRAKLQAEGRDAAVLAAIPEALVLKALSAAAGNPGLQDILTRPLLNGEIETAAAAIDAVMRYRQSMAYPPEDNEAYAFFARVSFETYTQALTQAQRVALAAAALFEPELPIPRAAIAAAADALGVAEPERAIDRLLALGLLDDWGSLSVHNNPARPHAAANPLARPLAAVVTDEARARGAGAALPAMCAAWRNEQGEFPSNSLSLAAAHAALLAQPLDPQLLDAAALAAVVFLFAVQHRAREALSIAAPALARFDQLGHQPGGHLLGHAIKAAARLGDARLQDQLLQRALGGAQLDAHLRAQLLGLQADRLVQLGQPDEALRIRVEELLPVFESLGDRRSLALTRGQIADILQARGQLDEALRIRVQDEVPVYESLGDRRSLAVTRGQIADILQARGQLDEALRIRVEELLPVFESLGDRRSLALTRGRIADILQARGQLDEALRIRVQDEVPVYESLGDRRELAVTRGQIADILQARGQLDEALRIIREEEVPVYESLGDRRSLAVTRGKIADILQARGQLDEALRIRVEDEVPVFESLGDRRELAVTRGKIADILQARGQLDEALQIHESRLADAQAMRDLDSLVHIRLRCAQLRLQRGDLQRPDGRQTIANELVEAWHGARTLGRPDFIGATGTLLGQMLALDGMSEQGIAVLEQAAAAWDRLGGDVNAAHCRELIRNIGVASAPDG